MRGLGRRLAVWLLFFATALIMFAWMFPFISPQSIGNDYLIFSPGAEVDMMWSVWKGTFPLYMPGYASGHSTASMTMGQLYHPIPWISSLVPGYWGGHALQLNSLFRLLSLGGAHLALFKLCRRLLVNPLPAFLLTFPVVYNLRMLDSFRYGASIDSYIGMLYVAAAGGFVYLDYHKKLPVALLGFATYLTAVSGHPQWAFLGLLISGVFTLLFPWTARAINPDLPRTEWRWFWQFVKRITVGFGTGVLLGSPYLLTFYFEYFKNNHSRAENDYTWTLGWGDSFRGEIANFMYPLHADVHGAFAGSAFFLVAAMFPLAAIVRRPPRILWAFYGIAVITLLYALGKETWVHHAMVTHLPLFGAFRVPGRIVIWIPLTILPLFAWMLRRENRPALFAAAAGASVLLAMNWLWTTNTLPDVEYFTPHKILTKNIPRFMDSLLVTLFLATTLLLACAARFKRAFRPLLVLSGLLMMLTSWLCIFDGTWRQKAPAMLTFEQVADSRKASVLARSDPGYGMEMRTVTEYKSHKLKPERQLGTIAHQVEQAPSEAEILKRLVEKGAKSPLPLYIDRPVTSMSPEIKGDHDEVKLTYNTSNRFVFNVVAAKDGYFVLGLPHLPGFRATVDGAPAQVAKANALFSAIFVPRGAHRVDFRFISWPFMIGVSLCFLTVWAWIFVAVRRRRWLVPVFAVVSAAALGGVLYASLYHGPSFETKYQWQAPVDAKTSSL
jgi:hypothetical protein